MFRKFCTPEISNRLPNRYFPKIDVGCPCDTLQYDPQKKITVPHEKSPLTYNHNDGICLLWYKKRLRLHSTVITMTTAFSDVVCLYFDPDTKRMKFGTQCSFQKSRNHGSSHGNEMINKFPQSTKNRPSTKLNSSTNKESYGKCLARRVPPYRVVEYHLPFKCP